MGGMKTSEIEYCVANIYLFHFSLSVSKFFVCPFTSNGREKKCNMYIGKNFCFVGNRSNCCWFERRATKISQFDSIFNESVRHFPCHDISFIIIQLAWWPMNELIDVFNFGGTVCSMSLWAQLHSPPPNQI